MQQLTKEHLSWIKQLLVEKLNRDDREAGKEIRFEESVERTLARYTIAKRTIRKLIRDCPIKTLKPLNTRFTRYLIGIEGTHGRMQVRVELLLEVDRSGIDFKISKLDVRQ